jgi:hypothetical protein
MRARRSAPTPTRSGTGSQRPAPPRPAEASTEAGGPSAFLHPTVTGPATWNSRDVQLLQRALGNQAVGRLLAGTPARRSSHGRGHAAGPAPIQPARVEIDGKTVELGLKSTDDLNMMVATHTDKAAEIMAEIDKRTAAQQVVSKFRTARSKDGSLEKKTPSFEEVTHKQVCSRLQALIDAPYALDQGSLSFCGASAFLSSMLARSPVDFAGYVLNLCSSGAAKVGSSEVSAASGFESPKDEQHVDARSMAALQYTANSWGGKMAINKQLGQFAWPGNIVDWFKSVGATEVRDNMNITGGMDGDVLQEASQLFSQGKWVVMYVHKFGCESWGGDITKAFSQDLTNFHYALLSGTVSEDGDLYKCSIVHWGKEDTFLAPKADAGRTFKGYVSAGFS